MKKQNLTAPFPIFSTDNRWKRVLLTLVVWTAISASSLQAFCVYNLTDYPVTFTINQPISKQYPNVGKYNEASDSPRNCYNYQGIGDGSRTAKVWVWVQIEQLKFEIGISMEAGGYLKVFEHLEEGGVKKAIKVVSYTYDQKELETYPKLSTPGNRDIHFLATADPQYLKPSIEDKDAAWQQAYAVMDRLSNLMDYGRKYRGTIVAGDLTGYSRNVEFQEYEKPFRKNYWTRYLYDGLGNHDFQPGNCCAGTGSLDQEWRGYCICPEEIAEAVGDRKRSTPLWTRLGPNYSWDWHDVHFAQLNLMPGNGTKGYDDQADIFNTYNSLLFLEADLRKNVGNSGRPVILTHHYGVDEMSRACTDNNTDRDRCGSTYDGDAPWWTQEERKAYWNVIANYNVVLIITGHLHKTGGFDWWKTEWTRPSGLTNGPNSIQTVTAGGARDGGYYMDFQITNNEIIANRYEAYDLTPSLSTVKFRKVGALSIPISRPGEKPAHLSPQIETPNPNQLIYIKNVVDNRFLFDPAPALERNRGAEGGWSNSPQIVASDANYYSKAGWHLQKQPDGTYFIINTVSKRYLLAAGQKPAGSEGGWTSSPKIVSSDDNYDNRAKWRIQNNNDGTYCIINHANNRYVFSTGSAPTQSEGGWTNSPKVVGSDANYYNKAQWNISGPGVSILK